MNSSDVPTHHSERVSPLDISNKLKTIATHLRGLPDSEDVNNTPITTSLNNPNQSPSKLSKWEHCRDAMKALQQLASEISVWGGDQRLFVNLFEMHVQEELVRQVKNLKAHTIKEACSTISAIMPVLQNHSPSFLSAVLPVLFYRMMDIEVSFIIDDCVQVLLKSAGFASVAKILLSFLSHSHQVVRAKCTAYMIEGMAATPKEDLEKIDNGNFAEILRKEIPRGLDDPETRNSSEELFREIRRKWPELAEKIGSNLGFSPPAKRQTSVSRIVRSDGGSTRRPREGSERRTAISAKASPRSRGSATTGLGQRVPSVRDSAFLQKSRKPQRLSANYLSYPLSPSGLPLNLTPSISDPYLSLAEGRDRSPPNIIIAAPEPDPDPKSAPVGPSGTPLATSYVDEDDFVISLEEFPNSNIMLNPSIDFSADSEDMVIIEDGVTRNRTPSRVRGSRQHSSPHSPSTKLSSRRSNRSRAYLRTPSCDYVIEDESPGYSPRRNTSPDPLRHFHRRLSNDYVIEDDVLPRSVSQGGSPLKASVIIDDEALPKSGNRIGSSGNYWNLRKISRQYSEDAVVEEEVTATLERSSSGIWEKPILDIPIPQIPETLENSKECTDKHSDSSTTPHYEMEDDVVLGSYRSPKGSTLSSAFGLSRQRSTPPSLRSQRSITLEPLAFRATHTWCDNSNDEVVDVSHFVRNFLSENDSPFKLVMSTPVMIGEGPSRTSVSPLRKPEGRPATIYSKPITRTKNFESEDEILEEEKEILITFSEIFHPDGTSPPTSPVASPKTAPQTSRRRNRVQFKEFPRESALGSRSIVRRRPKKRPKEEVDDVDVDGCKNIPLHEKKHVTENTEDSSGEDDGDRLEEVTAGLVADM